MPKTWPWASGWHCAQTLRPSLWEDHFKKAVEALERVLSQCGWPIPELQDLVPQLHPGCGPSWALAESTSLVAAASLPQYPSGTVFPPDFLADVAVSLKRYKVSRDDVGSDWTKAAL